MYRANWLLLVKRKARTIKVEEMAGISVAGCCGRIPMIQHHVQVKVGSLNLIHKGIRFQFVVGLYTVTTDHSLIEKETQI